jgi:hypothetical protein
VNMYVYIMQCSDKALSIMLPRPEQNIHGPVAR